MPKPLYIPNSDQRASNIERRVRRIERRSCGPWHYVGQPGEPPFQNGWTNTGGGLTPLRFRWLLGGGAELEGHISGGADNTIIFSLPHGYYNEGGETRRVLSFKDDGTPIPIKISPVLFDTTLYADVYKLPVPAAGSAGVTQPIELIHSTRSRSTTVTASYGINLVQYDTVSPRGFTLNNFNDDVTAYNGTAATTRTPTVADKTLPLLFTAPPRFGIDVGYIWADSGYADFTLDICGGPLPLDANGFYDTVGGAFEGGGWFTLKTFTTSGTAAARNPHFMSSPLAIRMLGAPGDVLTSVTPNGTIGCLDLNGAPGVYALRFVYNTASAGGGGQKIELFSLVVMGLTDTLL